MSIVLDGTTGITTPDLTSASPMDIGGSAVLTSASSLASANLTGALPAIDGSALTGINGTPIGAVVHFAASAAPSGFLKANGASLSTTTYATLFAVIGYTFGGSGASFNLPDLRGEFLRGWDDARGVDSGRAFGSAQANEIQAHNHLGGLRSIYLNDGAYGRVLGASGVVDSWAGGYYERYQYWTSTVGGTETRPRNVALLACIKY